MPDAPAPAAEQPVAASIKLTSLAAALLLTGLADYLFLRRAIGWTAGLFYMAFLFIAVLLKPACLRGWGGKALFVLNFGVAASFVEEPSLPGVCLLTLLLPSFLLQIWTFDSKQSDKVFSLFSAVPEATSAGAEEIGALITECYLHLRRAKAAEALKNVFVPLLFTAIFTALFYEANPVIERYLDAIKLEWHPDISRIAFWGLVLPLLFAALRLRAHALQPEPPLKNAAGPGEGDSIDLAHILPPAVIVLSLISFNALFLLNNLLDLRFLWSGASLPEGLTYAEYAHRGAYVLVLTALLSGAFVLIALKAGSSQIRWQIRLLMGVWLVQNIFLICSSVLRTNTYIAAYSLTYLRLYALIWMGLTAVGLILIGAKIVFKKSNVWLVRANIISLIAVLYASCFADFGNLIATYNVEHCLEMSGKGPKLDTAYLRNAVGLSALPALRRYRQQVGYPSAIASGQRMLTPDWPLQNVPASEVLKDNRDRVPESLLLAKLWAEIDNWRTWTYRKHRLGNLTGRQPFIANARD
jgi:hypothetical protein